MQTITVTEIVVPPEALLEPCPRPSAAHLETNEDLLKFTSDAVMKWEICAAQVEGLREFFGLDKDDQKTLSDAPVAGEPH